MAESRGMAIVRSDDTSILFRAALYDVADAKITSGTTSLRLWHIVPATGAVETYDFNDDTFKTGAVTTPTATMTHRQAENSTYNTGVWTYRHATLTDFTVGDKYVAEVSHTSLTRELHIEFQYGSTEGDVQYDVWEEILTSGTHNVANSAGRRLREIGTSVIRENTAQGAGTGNNQVQLDAGASATNGIYDPSVIVLTGGTGQGQCRMIIEYDGATKTATVDRNWRTNPDATTTFQILAYPGREHVNEGLVTAATATTVTLNTAASSDDNAYLGQTIFIRSGTGEDQARVIASYVGATKIALLNRPWDTTPDTTSGYIMLPHAVDVGWVAAAGAGSVTTGSSISGAYTDTAINDAAYWVLAPAGAAVGGFGLNVEFTFSLGQQNRASQVVIDGNWTGSGTIYVWAWNYFDSVWVKISHIHTEIASSSDETHVYPLFHPMIQPTDGEVKIRLTSTSTTTADRLNLDQLVVRAVPTGDIAVGDQAYAVFRQTVDQAYDGAVHIDTVNGASGTDLGCNGTPTHPVDNLADARVIADLLGVKAYRLFPGSTITLASEPKNFAFYGTSATVDLGSQDVDRCVFENMQITGTGTIATPFLFPVARNCLLNALTLPSLSSERCNMRDVFASTASRFHIFTDANQGETGATIPEYTFAASCEAHFWRYSGRLTLKSMAAGCIAYVEGTSVQLTIDASCSGGVVNIAGNVHLVDNSGGAVTINQEARVTELAIASGVWDENIVTAHGTLQTSGYLLRQLGAAIAARTNNSNLNALLGVTDAPGVTLPTVDADAVWDENIVTAHGAAQTAGLLLRALGATIASRTNYPTLNELLAVPDVAGNTIAHTIFDRVLSAALHNVADSAGRRIRDLDDLLKAGGAGDAAAILGEVQKLDAAALTAPPTADSVAAKLNAILTGLTGGVEFVVIVSIRGTELHIEVGLEELGIIKLTPTTCQVEFFAETGGLVHTIAAGDFGAIGARGFFTYDWASHTLQVGKAYQLEINIDAGTYVSTKLIKIIST